MEMLTLSLHTIISILAVYTYAAFCVKRLIIGSGCPHKKIDKKEKAGGGRNSVPTPPDANAPTTSSLPHSEDGR
jgi:hypothetical protein